MKRGRVFTFCAVTLAMTAFHVSFVDIIQRAPRSLSTRSFASVPDQSGLYGIVFNAVPADKPLLSRDVTVVAQMDASRLQGVPLLADAWEGPIQMAVFITSRDLWTFVMDVISHMRICNENVKRFVTWHIMYPKRTCFNTLEYEPCKHHIAKDTFIRNIPRSPPPEQEDENHCSLLPDEIELLSKKTLELAANNSNSRHIAYYPQTIAMNVALKSAKADFIFAIDADLTPSTGLRKQFLKFAENLNLFGIVDSSIVGDKVGEGLMITETKTYRIYIAESTFVKTNSTEPICARHVDGQRPPADLYVVPTFEIKNATIPRTIDALRAEFYSERAQCFYCRFCYPAYAPTDHATWLLRSDEGGKDKKGNDLALETSCVYEVRYQHSYEPFFIARRGIPLFDERFIGHTQVDSHHVALLAAMGYRFKVLKNVFLVHDGWKLPQDWTKQQWKESSRDPDFWLNYLEDLDVKYQGKRKEERPPEIH